MQLEVFKCCSFNNLVRWKDNKQFEGANLKKGLLSIQISQLNSFWIGKLFYLEKKTHFKKCAQTFESLLFELHNLIMAQYENVIQSSKQQGLNYPFFLKEFLFGYLHRLRLFLWNIFINSLIVAVSIKQMHYSNVLS